MSEKNPPSSGSSDDHISEQQQRHVSDEEKARQTHPKNEGAKENQIRRLTGFKWFLFVISTLSAIFLYALDNTIVANIVPAIANQFNAVNQLPWLSVGFMIGGVAMAMPLGKLYSLYDGKWLFIISSIVFFAASALCGGTPTMNGEIVGRVFAGAGGNGMYLGLIQLLSLETTSRERPAYLSLTYVASTAVWGIGTVIGPAIGGALELYTWRWAFYINLLFAAILLPTYLVVIPNSKPTSGMTKRERAASFDWVGALLSISAFALPIIATQLGGLINAWNDPSTIVLFLIGGLLWVAFGIQQTFNTLTSAENRMFPVHLMRNKEAVLLFIITACVASISYVSVYYIPLYFQFTRGDSAIITAKPRIGVETSTSTIYGYEALIGIGAGAYTQASFAVIQANVEPKDAPAAQLSGLAFGLSVAGAIFLNLAQNALKNLLPDIPLSSIQQIISGTSGGVLSSLPPDLRQQALEAIVGAWQKISTLALQSALSYRYSLA
ncbi:MAG: hypothetical protein Q9186_003621 [Xanthomendoza sp. 1 TL-2023]